MHQSLYPRHVRVVDLDGSTDDNDAFPPIRYSAPRQDYHHPPSYLAGDQRYSFGQQPPQGVVTPYPVPRMVRPQLPPADPQRVSPYDESHNWLYHPMAGPPLKLLYIGPPGSAHQDGRYETIYHVPEKGLWYNDHINAGGAEPAYNARRYSEVETSGTHSCYASSHTAVDGMRPVKVRKVSVGGSCGSLEADAKLLLEASAAFRSAVPSPTMVQCPFANKLDGCELVSLDLYGSVPDPLFLSMAQMKLCRLNDEDRFGNYRHRKVGMIGIACKHCGGLSGFGRHFPSSFQSLLSGSHCVRIVKHVRSECRACPHNIRQLLLELDKKEQISHDHGSRKRFVSFVWSRLQSASGNQLLLDDGTASCVSNEEPEAAPEESPATALRDDDPTIPWETILGHSELIEAQDRYLVPDSTLFSLTQMKPHPLEEEDQIGRHKEQYLGFMGELYIVVTLSSLPYVPCRFLCRQVCAAFTVEGRPANLVTVDFSLPA
jgi:hypothetical protein